MRTEEKRGRDEEGREGGKRGGYRQIEIESLKTYVFLPPA